MNYVSYAYTLKEDTTYDEKISTSGDIVVKFKYLSYMKENTRWYLGKKYQQQLISVTTCTILHPCLYIF